LIWFVYKYTITVTIVKTGFYGLWLKWGLTSRTLLDNAAKETEKLKTEVREQICRMQRDERKKQDEEWEKAHGITPLGPPTNTFRQSIHTSTGLENPQITRLRGGGPLETV
jgi:hypothetical protein